MACHCGAWPTAHNSSVCTAAAAGSAQGAAPTGLNHTGCCMCARQRVAGSCQRRWGDRRTTGGRIGVEQRQQPRRRGGRDANGDVPPAQNVRQRVVCNAPTRKNKVDGDTSSNGRRPRHQHNRHAPWTRRSYSHSTRASDATSGATIASTVAAPAAHAVHASGHRAASVSNRSILVGHRGETKPGAAPRLHSSSGLVAADVHALPDLG